MVKNHFFGNKAKETKRDLAKREAKIKLVLIIQVENKWNWTPCPKNTYIRGNTSSEIDSWDSAKDNKEPHLLSRQGANYTSPLPLPPLHLALIHPAKNMNFELLQTIETMERAMEQWTQPKEGMLAEQWPGSCGVTFRTDFVEVLGWWVREDWILGQVLG